MKTNSYVSPVCETLILMNEGSVLASSSETGWDTSSEKFDKEDGWFEL